MREDAQDKSLSGAFAIRRGTVLADTDFRNLELWTEEDEEQHRDEEKDDYAANDDFELDDSIRYRPLNVKSVLNDVWDRLCCRNFYRIEGEKFYFLKTIMTSDMCVLELCQFEGSPYVIKRIPLREPEDLIRAADQFNNLRNYDHPHVVFAYKAGIGNSPIWTNWTRTEVRLVLPYITGHLLSVELEERRLNKLWIHPRRILRILREIMDGLFEIHSHSNGDAHRNIRPGTIMIRVPDDWPVIVELDCCSPAVVMTNDDDELQQIIQISNNVTSLFYRAPETFDISIESVIDERTDIWAAGCLLFAMCFFRSPFQPEDVSDPPPSDFAIQPVRDAILNLKLEHFLDHIIPSDSPYPAEMHGYMARLLSVDLLSRPTTEQAIRELDDLIAKLGGPDQPICVKYPWVNPTADEMAADVLRNRHKAVELDFDKNFPNLRSYSYAEARANCMIENRDHCQYHIDEMVYTVGNMQSESRFLRHALRTMRNRGYGASRVDIYPRFVKNNSTMLGAFQPPESPRTALRPSRFRIPSFRRKSSDSQASSGSPRPSDRLMPSQVGQMEIMPTIYDDIHELASSTSNNALKQTKHSS